MRRTYCVELVVCVLWLGVAQLTLAQTEQAPSKVVQRVLRLTETSDPQVRAMLLELTADDIRVLCDAVQPAGASGDATVRRALHGLAFVAGEPEHTALRKTYIGALRSSLADDAADPDFLLEQLNLVAPEAAVDVLAERLHDEATCRNAALLLAGTRSGAADRVLTDALDGSAGDCLVAVIDALAGRRDNAALGKLLRLTLSEDRAVRLAAIRVLGTAELPAATEPMWALLRENDERARRHAAECLLDLAARHVEHGRVGAAADVYRSLMARTDQAHYAHVRCAALRGIAQVLDVGALGEVLRALGDEESFVRAVARELAVSFEGSEVTDYIVAEYDNASAIGRIAMLETLVERGSRRGLSAAIKGLDDAYAEVRMVAIDAVAALGQDRAVRPLVGKLEHGAPEERHAVRRALIALPGDTATRELQQVIDLSNSMLAVRLLNILSKRPSNGEFDKIDAAVISEEDNLRRAAYHAYGALADESYLPKLIQTLRLSREEADIEAIGDAIAAIVRRTPSESDCVTKVLAAFEGAHPRVQAKLYLVLGKIGGPQAQSALITALGSDQRVLVDAALDAFQTWPDTAPARDLLEFADQTESLTWHVHAIRAFARMVGRTETLATTERVRLAADGLAACDRPEEQRLLVARLAELHHPAALEALIPHATDEHIAGEVAVAIQGVAKAISPLHWREAQFALGYLAVRGPTPAITELAEATLVELEPHTGLVTEWLVAGPYTRVGETGRTLFDVSFPPESAPFDASVWSRLAPPEDPHDGWRVDLEAAFSGAAGVAYLRSRIHSPKAQAARLEVGSDDGIKVWLNSELVHANNVLRGVRLGEDVAAVELEQGWNDLLLKVPNEGGGWGASVRVRDPNGAALSDVYSGLTNGSMD